MTENSKIEWTHATFNMWRGCTKVSAGCAHCYAETLAGRNPGTLGVWGRNGERVIAAESYWRQPLKWNRDALAAGERRRVFCASLADVFEGQDSMPERAWAPVAEARARLFALIQATPELDWLLLTKRPENITGMLPADWGQGYPNVWLGTSVENQAAADTRIPHLLAVPAAVRFLSCEPLLGAVELPWQATTPMFAADDPRYHRPGGRGVDWVIAGGESGPGARPMHPDWARGLRDQCQAAGVAFLFKQWGEWAPWTPAGPDPRGHSAGWFDNADRWHEGEINSFRQSLVRVGKKAAGRVLDGRTWDEYPEVVNHAGV